jgi:energy-coupling factor transporter ATP-binding protein EcfA2
MLQNASRISQSFAGGCNYARPPGAKDTESISSIIRDLHLLPRARIIRIITISHDPYEAKAKADRVWVLGGRRVFSPAGR